MLKSLSIEQRDEEDILALVAMTDANLFMSREVPDEDDPMFQDIINWVESENSTELVSSKTSGLIHAALSAQIEFALQTVDKSDANIDTDAVFAAMLPIYLEHIRIINKHTVLRIREAIARGIRESMDIRSIGNLILDMFDRFVQTRAALIARTEILSAMNYGAHSAYNFVGVPYKSWSTILDGRERDSHNVAHGQIVPMNSYFIVGGDQLRYPGDPNGSPEEIINCRCSVMPEFNPDSSVWNSTAMEAMLKAHQAMHDRFSASMQDAFGVVFLEQRTIVATIINRALR